MAFWLKKLPDTPGLYDHRNLENAGGRVPIPARTVFVGYVNWTEDPLLGQGTKPTPYMPARLRAVRVDQPLTADSLTVNQWGGEWRKHRAECTTHPADGAADQH